MTLPPCPSQNRNTALLGAANRCRHAGLAPVEAESLLERWISRTPRRGEIERAVAKAYDTTPTTPRLRSPVRVAVNVERREAIAADGPGLADLWESSPIRFDDDDQHTEQLVDQLFPGDPLLCCGKSNREFDTRTREEWRGQLANLSLIVPSLMISRTGTTQDGRESAHTLASTGTRRFLVCEFDSGSTDEQAAVLMHLAGFAPLVLVVFSGSKSLHGWFLTAGTADDKVSRFFSYAVTLGADPATWTRSQFVRMPDGTRDNGNRQTVYFFNPQPLEVKPE